MKLTEQIDFEINFIFFEAKSNFNLQQFEKLPTLQDKVNYASTNLKELGRGSSRVVYLISNRYVLKLALPEAGAKGTGQNKGEVDVYNNKGVSPYVAKVYRNDPKFDWIISEIARPMASEQEFEQLAKVDWGIFDYLVRQQDKWKQVAEEEIADYTQQIQKLTNRMNALGTETAQKDLGGKIQNLNKSIQRIQATAQSPVFKAAIALVTKGNVSAGDVREWSHWAKTSDNRMIIIDYGFTKDLQDLYKTNAA